MENEIHIDRWKSFVSRYYLLLKGHYILSSGSLSSFGSILNLTLCNRGLSSIEISRIYLIISFLIFVTNPLIVYVVFVHYSI